MIRNALSVDTAVFFRTQPINFEGILLSTSEHGFSFGYPPLAICVRPFLKVIRENHSGISIVYSEYCSTVVYKCAFFFRELESPSSFRNDDHHVDRKLAAHCNWRLFCCYRPQQHTTIHARRHWVVRDFRFGTMKRHTTRSIVKFDINCMQPMNNKVLNAASFEEYLHDRIKIGSKTVALTAKIATITRDRTKVTVVSPAELGFSKRQLKYLSKRYSRKQQVRDNLSVVDGSKKS